MLLFRWRSGVLWIVVPGTAANHTATRGRRELRPCARSRRYVPRVRQGIEVKDSDSRAHDYIHRFGRRCWEVDVLPATTIEAALAAHIKEWLDRRLWEQRAAEIERGWALLQGREER